MALLQSRLMTMGHTIATSEILGELFGESTQQAVIQFQQAEGLPVTGRVDGATAQAEETKMATIVNRAGFWNDQVWGSIDDGVTKAVGAIRVLQKVFPIVQLANAPSVPADVFNPEKMCIAEGHTWPFIELAVEFPLTNGQVNFRSGDEMV